MKSLASRILPLLLLASAGRAAEPDPREWAASTSLEAAMLTVEAGRAWQAGRAEEARQKFTEAVARDPQALLARLLLGDLHLAANQVEEAEKAWRALVVEGDRDSRLPHRVRAAAAIRLGNLLRDQGRDQAALYFYSKPLVWDHADSPVSSAYFAEFGDAWRSMRDIHARAKAPGYGTPYAALHNQFQDASARARGTLVSPYRQPYLNLGLLELEETAPVPPTPAATSWAGRVSPEELPGTIHLPSGAAKLAPELTGPAVWVLPLRDTSTRPPVKHPGPVRLDCAAGTRVTLPTHDLPVLSACGTREGMVLLRQGGQGDLVDPAGKSLRKVNTHSYMPGQLLYCPRTGRLYGVDPQMDQLKQIQMDPAKPAPAFIPMGAAGNTWVIDPERGLLYGMMKSFSQVIGVHNVFQDAGLSLPDWWLPLQKGPAIIALSMGGDGVLVPLSLRALPTLETGATLSISSDGAEITVAGGGGSPVFDGSEVRARREARSFFRRHFIDLPAAYPAGRPELPTLGAWHHPFAPVVAVLDAEGVSFHPRGGAAEPARFAGSYLPGGAWTADGTSFLLLRRPQAESPAFDATPVAFRVALGPEDLAAGKARRDQLAAWASAGAEGRVAAATPGAPAPRAFPVTTNLVEAVAAVQAALAAPGDRLSPDWQGADGYGRAPVHPLFMDILDVAQGTRPGDEPFGLVRAKKWFPEDKPPYAPAFFVRGMLRVAPSQRGAGVGDLLEAARLDGAATSLARLGLLEAARRSARDGQDARALSCYAAAIALDAPTRELLEEMAPLLARHGVKGGGKAADLATRASASANEPAARPRIALRFPPPSPAPAVAPTPGDLHQRARRATATGRVADSPFCAVLIDTAGHLLTMAAKLPDSGDVQIAFARAGDDRPAPPVRAEILVRDARAGLALLRVRDLPPGATPLELSDTIPPVGTRVHALSGEDPRPDAPASPGLSAGIISGPPRLVDGVEMLQHSAAVNRHGVGGPVLDPSGKLTGLSARDSHLENVAFALPATRLRAWLREIAPEEKP